MKLCGRDVGLDQPIFLIAGPCAIESETLAVAVAERLRTITERLGLLFIFKSSFDKANRTSGASYRGPGIDEGLRILRKVQQEVGVPVLTDVHDISQVIRLPRSSTCSRHPRFSPDRPTSSMRQRLPDGR